ncbi:MAG: transposase [Chloroflexota bacterium]
MRPRPPRGVRRRTRRAAVAAYWRWARAWRGRHPVLVRRLEADLDDLLAVFSLPEPVRASLRTTNLLERAFRELRRGSGRSAPSQTAGRPTGSCTARCCASASSWPGARSPHSHKSLDVILGG